MFICYVYCIYVSKFFCSLTIRRVGSSVLRLFLMKLKLRLKLLRQLKDNLVIGFLATDVDMRVVERGGRCVEKGKLQLQLCLEVAVAVAALLVLSFLLQNQFSTN